MKQLKPNDISVMRTAIGLYAQPFGVESFDQYEYGLAPEFTLSEDEAKFVTDALRQLIVRDNQSLQYEKRPKCIRECEKEIRAATVCISRIS